MRYLSLIFLFISFYGFSQNAAINADGSDPHNSAMLDVKSTSKGLLIPRMTTAQRTAINSPATGLLVFDNTTNSFWFYNGSAWANLDGQNLSLDGNTLNIGNGTSVDLTPFKDNTDAQDLSLSNNTLSLTNDGTTVDLAAYLDNTDAQNLSLNGDTLNISGGASVDLSSFKDNTDAQDLSLSNNTLSLTNDGTTVDLAAYLDNTDAQNLSLSGDSLNISGGASVDLSSFKDNTDAQNLSLSGNTLNISNGTGVDLSPILSASDQIIDANQNTKVILEETANDDLIKFISEGKEYMRLDSGRLEFYNTKNSIVIGQNAEQGTSETSNRDNIIIGNNSAKDAAAYRENVVIGHNNIQNGYGANDNNVVIGDHIFNGLGNNDSNVAIGYYTMSEATSSNYQNIAIGSYALNKLSGSSDNVAIGQNAMKNHATGYENVVIGDGAKSSGTTGRRNTILGANAGSLIAGDHNVIIGRQAGNQATGANNVFLGHQAGYYETGSDKLYIENTLTTTPLIWGDFVNDSVKIHGTFGIGNEYSFPTTDGTSGQTLQTDGAGSLSWVGGGDIYQLNGNWISNDGGSEGLSVNNSGGLIGESSGNNVLNLRNTTGLNQAAFMEIKNGTGARVILGTGGINFNGAATVYDAVISNWKNGGAIRFYTKESGSVPNERMSIAANGNVHVNGTLSAGNFVPDNFNVSTNLSVGNNLTVTNDLTVTRHLNVNNNIKLNGNWLSNDGGNEGIRVDNNGNVGIGTAPTNGKLEVSGFLFKTYAFKPYTSGGVGNHGTYGTNISIYAGSAIAAGELQAFSDQRIKKNQEVSNGKEDLETIQRIEITNYQLIDSLAEGKRQFKKVIAQQVKEVYPQAVNNNIIRAIPDIYKLSKIEKGWVSLDQEVEVGERIKLISEGKEGIYEVLEIKNDAFRVDFDYSGDVFVYGREVNDFHTVDYEALSMLNISATQELIKQFKAQQNEIEALKKENSAIKAALSEVSALKTELEQIRDMLQLKAQK